MRRVAIRFFTLSVLCMSINGQASRGGERRAAPFLNLPAGLDEHVAALGERMSEPGKERLVLIGQFQDRERRVPIRVTLQHPDFVRVDGLHPAAPALTLDGDTRRRYSHSDEDLLEVLSADTPEGLFSAARNGAAINFLGARFKPRDRDYHGPQYDIYEVTGAVSPSEQRYLSKRYAFDSDTGLLANVQYVDERRNVRMETRFSEWTMVAGSQFPGRIDRLENNEIVFSLQFTSASTLPRQETAEFPILEEPVVAPPQSKE